VHIPDDIDASGNKELQPESTDYKEASERGVALEDPAEEGIVCHD
jgi:hypothetical protein